MSIRTKLGLMIGGLVVLVAGAIATGLYLAERKALLVRLESTQKTLIRQFAQNCRDTLIVHDELAAISATQALAKTDGVIRAYFIDGNGRVLAHSKAQEIGKTYALSKAETPRRSEKNGLKESGPDAVVTLSERVSLGNGPPATAVIDFSQTALETLVRQTLHGLGRRILEVTGAALLIGLLGAWALARNLIRPIKILALATERLAAGDLKHRIFVDRSDELGRLGADFNRMALKLSELDQMKEDFVSNVTHELRSPLFAIESYANVISDEWRADRKENIPDYLTILRNNATRLGRFINDILDTAKIEARAVEVKKQPLDPVVALNDVVSLFIPKAREKSIRLITEKVPAGLSLFADPDKLHQIMTNLTANAIKFTPTGGTVTLQAASVSSAIDPSLREAIDRAGLKGSFPKTFIRISVSDTGPGIRPEDQERIFNRFEQVRDIRNSIHGAKGTGLGLAIARGLTDAHGGVLTLHSVFGQGSVFSVYIPEGE